MPWRSRSRPRFNAEGDGRTLFEVTNCVRPLSGMMEYAHNRPADLGSSDLVASKWTFTVCSALRALARTPSK